MSATDEKLVPSKVAGQKSPRCSRCCCRPCRSPGCYTHYLLVAVLPVAVVFWQHRSEDTFDDKRATTFALLAGAAYCSQESLEAWDCGDKCISGVEQPVHVCQGETTQAYVARWEGQGLVVFQGTKSYSSMIQDLRFYKSMTEWERCGNCSVHTGFFAEWLSLEPCVKDALAAIGSPAGSPLRVTGHSLGGAVGSLAMLDLAEHNWSISEAITFGMPRAGSEDFSNFFASTFDNTTFFRVTFHKDPVPHLPPEYFGFFHLPPEIFFETDFTNHVECMDAEDDACADHYDDIVVDLYWSSDHMSYMGVNTSSAGCQEPQPSTQQHHLVDVVV